MDNSGWVIGTSCGEGGHEAVVKQLLANNADVNVQTSIGYTPLHGAAKKGRSEVVLLLLDKGAGFYATTQVKGVCDQTALHFAVSGKSEEHTTTVVILLIKGADVDAKTASGEAPLHTLLLGGVT